MPHSQLSVQDAYEVLGLSATATIDEVKSTYRQVALRTHPDKNPGNPDATAEFQRVSEAYNVLDKHHSGSYEDDYYSDDSDEFGLSFKYFKLWVFEEDFLGGTGRGPFNTHRYQYSMPRYQHPAPPQETPAEYKERIKRTREEQIAAEKRRKEAAIARKQREEQERVQARLEAERRQKAKVDAKKAEAEAQRQKAEKAEIALLQRAQILRSQVFAAARAGNSDMVKKGIWEDAVDASGGETNPKSESFVTSPPLDPHQTLLHIAVQSGDLALFKWLDAHGADTEEKNADGLTAFHLALQAGQVHIVAHLLEEYPPSETAYSSMYDIAKPRNLLLLALESHDPELVWMILERGLAKPEEIEVAWTLATSMDNPFQTEHKQRGLENGKLDDIAQLLMRYGGLTPPLTPLTESQEGPINSILPSAKGKSKGHFHRKSSTTRTGNEEKYKPETPRGPNPPFANRGRGHAKPRGRGRGHARGPSTPANR